MLIGVEGRMGQGKTLSMTYLGLYMSSLMKVPLYANYTLQGVRYSKVNTLDDLWKAESGIILLDELWLSMEARLIRDNVLLSRWLNQTRKKDLVIIYTTQHISQIDVRVRRATDWLIYCEKKLEGIWLNFIEYQFGLIGRKILIKNPGMFYRFYNTYEVLRPLV